MEWEDIRIQGVLLEEVTTPRNDGTRGSVLYEVPFRFSRKPPAEWNDLFIRAWDRPPSFSTMHRPGIASIYGDKLVLDGTTMEEVRDVHEKTLKLVLDETNAAYKELQRRQAEHDARERNRHEDHEQHVEDIGSQLDFE